jgi:hypothetical protein
MLLDSCPNFLTQFSHDDVARFAKNCILLGDDKSYSSGGQVGGDGKTCVSSSLYNAIYHHQRRTILPTAEQQLCIREEEQRKELQRWTIGQETIVTLDSLPYVYEPSSEDIIQQQRRKVEGVNYKNDNDIIIDGFCQESHSSIDCQDEVKRDNVKEQDVLAIIALTARRVNTDPFQDYDDDDDEGDDSSSDEDVSDNESILLTENVDDFLMDNTGRNNAIAAAIPTVDRSKKKKSCIASSSSFETISGGCSSNEAIPTSSDWMTTYRRSESEVMDMLSLPSTSRRINNLPRISASSKDDAGFTGRKAAVDNNNWHRRRSELEVVVSRIKRKKQHSLSRSKRRQSTSTTSAVTATDMSAADEALQRRRTTLRFAAAPVAVNKRKKQKSLKDMFKL